MCSRRDLCREWEEWGDMAVVLGWEDMTRDLEAVECLVEEDMDRMGDLMGEDLEIVDIMAGV